MINIRKLSKTFGRRRVLDDLSFHAADGAITGLLGSNGAGKTTTLRIICGVLQPESGTVEIDPSRLGALLDHIGLYGRLTVRENLAYYGRLRAIPQSMLANRINEVVSLLGMNAIVDLPVAGFSQGERMKTALGRALLHDPRNLILDEPTNGLDIPTIRSLRELLRRLRDQGTCILFSSHALDEVRALCDHVVMIAAGSRAAEGSPQALCDKTQTASLEDAFVKLTC